MTLSILSVVIMDWVELNDLPFTQESLTDDSLVFTHTGDADCTLHFQEIEDLRTVFLSYEGNELLRISVNSENGLDAIFNFLNIFKDVFDEFNI